MPLKPTSQEVDDGVQAVQEKLGSLQFQLVALQDRQDARLDSLQSLMQTLLQQVTAVASQHPHSTPTIPPTPSPAFNPAPSAPTPLLNSAAQSPVFKFCSSHSTPRTFISSTTSAGAVDPMLKALDSDNAAAKTNILTAFSAGATTNTQPAFGTSSSVIQFGSAPPVNNDQMSMGDSMAEDTVQATTPVTPVFGQQPAPLQSNFAFGASAPTGANPFLFASQQNIAQQSTSPFQASGSLEFNAGGSFSLGTGGGDKAGRKFVKVKHRPRKK